MINVVIVNGKPGSGKTTFERICSSEISLNEYAIVDILSTIDPIKHIYKQLGWDGTKTDKARKDLSILKKMWVDNCDGPTAYIVKYLMGLLDDKHEHNNDFVVFIDIREEEEIIKLCEILSAFEILGIKWTTVFIDRPDNHGIEYGNKSDDMVGRNMSIYEHIIHNDGNLEDLRTFAEIFINKLMEGI